MTNPTVPEIALPNGLVVPADTVAGFLWADRQSGISWVQAFPEVLPEWLDRWRITLEPELPQHSMNLVLFGRSEIHGPVVIKTSPPHREITVEIDALRAHRSPRIVAVIDADPTVSIMLQRRILPGTTLRSQVMAGHLTEYDAAVIATRLMREYWIDPPADAPFIRLDEWFRALYDYLERFPHGGGRLNHRNVVLAVRSADELLSSQREALTLHGDLHHDNILLDQEQGWTIIDPKGLVGERGYDIGQWMMNPPGVHKDPGLAHLTTARLDWFSELLGIERYRLWQWAMVQNVLSDCWNLESNEEAELYAQPVADILADLPEARSS